tara:strand:- start:16757 stop:17398 length:642 start_codon:yes stop_codon:yes gene_type:complete
MTDIKICGIKNYKSALTAQQHGAAYIGFVFHKPSSRYIDPESASHIIKTLKKESQKSPTYVGLFVDSDLETISATGQLCDLDAVQLCGSETPEFCDSVPFPVFKVIHIKPSHKLADIEELIDIYLNHVDKLILDNGATNLSGGTGEKFDWRIAKQLADQGHYFMLAGGLNIDNLREAIQTINPIAIDISSGVETDGIKDPDKIINVLHLAQSF